MTDVTPAPDESSPLVSVIITTYNRPDYLQMSLASVLAQDLDDMEILVYDDCSNADNESIVRGFADDRIRYHRHPKNLGRGANNCAAYRAARGRYVAHLDDDDEWEPNFLASLIPPLEADEEITLAFCDRFLVSASGAIDYDLTARNAREWGRACLARGKHMPFQHQALVTRCVVFGSAAIVRRSALDLDDFPSELKFTWDAWIVYLAVRGGGAAYYEPDRLARVRVHAAQSIQVLASLETFSDISYCFRRFLADPHLVIDRKMLRKKLSVIEAYWSVASARAGNSVGARRHAGSAIRSYPTIRAVAVCAVVLLPASFARTLANIAARAKVLTVGRRRTSLYAQ